jgi:hypothetical protein
MHDPFIGKFDGDGHKIRNLTINWPNRDELGLFSGIDSSEIRNLGLENVKVVSNLDYVGALAGVSRGTIVNVYATGTVSGRFFTGGLVGQNYGAITTSFAAVSVNGGATVGGLAGKNQGSISNSYATGSVIGYISAGGLVGAMSAGSITNSYATGSVNGNDYVGGLVGFMDSGSITNSYATGSVNGNEYVGGLVGQMLDGSVTNSYYNKETTDPSDDEDKGEPKSTEEMRQQSTFVDWDFVNVWYILEGEDYPRLRWAARSGMAVALDESGPQIAGEPFHLNITDAKDESEHMLNGDVAVTVTSDRQAGTIFSGVATLTDGSAAVPIVLGAPGTHTLTVQVDGVVNPVTVAVEVRPFAGGNGDDEPYLIANAWQLDNVRHYLDKNFKLIADIDLEGTPFTNWEPIGKMDDPFTGKFDGDRHKIRNLTIDLLRDYVGLFGYVNTGAEIRNLGLEDVKVESSLSCVGALAGISAGAIVNVYATGDVSGGLGTGGLVGDNSGSITASFAAVSVKGTSQVGGLAGVNRDSISDSYAAGSVKSNLAGGLVGQLTAGSISDSYATGSVTGGMSGGLVGQSIDSTVTNSFYDWETTNQNDSGKGEPKSTEEMRQFATYVNWDFKNVWYIHDGHGYPRLRWEQDSWEDHSGFAVKLEEEGSKLYGEDFNLSITGAKGEFGQKLNGGHRVTVSLDTSTVLFDASVPFNQGDAAVTVSLKARGTHNLVVRVDGVRDPQSVPVEVNVLVESIVITRPPDKTEYFVGEELDLTGLEVKGVYTDNSEETLEIEELQFDGFNSGAPAAEQVVTVSYGDKSAAFTVTIKEPELTGIEIKTPPAKTVYVVGDALDPTGLVVEGIYENNARKILPIGDLQFSGFDSGHPADEQVVTVSYGDKSAAFTVTIAPDTEAPTVPANLRVVGKTATSVSLAWDASDDNTGVSRYEVEMRLGSGEWAPADAPVDTASTLTGLSPATEYVFRVRAADGAGNASDWSDELVVVTDSAGGSGGGNNSGNTGASEDEIRGWFIDLNGRLIQSDEIDTSLPTFTLRTGPTADVSAYVLATVGVLTELADQNPAFALEIETPFGGWLMPAALPSLIPDWDEMLEANGWRPEAIGFRLTLEDKTDDPEIRESLALQLPDGKLIGAVVNVHLDIVDAETGEALAVVNRFAEPVIRMIPVSAERFDPRTANWGAFRYDEASGEFVFVPARLEEREGRLYVVILSRSNSVYLATASEAGFADTEGHWGKAYAERAAAKGLVRGVGGGKFAPDRTVTRAEFAAMLVRALGQGSLSGGKAPYADVPRSAWYYEEVAQAKALGLLEFVEGDRLLPNRTLTREEMAAMLAAALRLEGLEADADGAEPNRYRDIGLADPAYLEAIRTVSAPGIMNGTGGGLFSPKDGTTRAQAAAVLLRTLRTLGWID